MKQLDIKKIKNYITKNILEISVKNHNIHKLFIGSKSTFEKYFVKNTSTTSIRYIKNKKIEKAVLIKNENPELSLKEIYFKVGYDDYSIETFRKNFAEFKKEEEPDIYFFNNRNVFIEILIRYLVHFEKQSIEKCDNYLSIYFNVKDTILQSSIFNWDYVHNYIIRYDDEQLYYMLILEQYDATKIDSPGTIETTITNSKLYFNLIYNLARKNKFISESIVDWETHLNGTGIYSLSFREELFFLNFKGFNNIKVELDLNSNFIIKTNYVIEKIESLLK